MTDVPERFRAAFPATIGEPDGGDAAGVGDGPDAVLGPFVEPGEVRGPEPPRCDACGGVLTGCLDADTMTCASCGREQYTEAFRERRREIRREARLREVEREVHAGSRRWLPVTDGGRLPNRAIHEAHLKCLEARQRVAVVDDPDAPEPGQNGRQGKPSATEELQKAVSLYYETLRSYLVSTPEGKRFFEGEVPEDGDHLGRGVLGTSVREEPVRLDKLPEPPADATSIEARQHYEEAIADLLRDDEVVAPPIDFDFEADPPVAYAGVRSFRVGLRQLDTIHADRVEVEVDDDKSSTFGGGGGFMVGEGGRSPETETKLQLQPLGLLMRAARELDRAAAELDLLAETEESDLKPYMRDFDASENGHATSEVSDVEISGSPEV